VVTGADMRTSRRRREKRRYGRKTALWHRTVCGRNPVADHMAETRMGQQAERFIEEPTERAGTLEPARSGGNGACWYKNARHQRRRAEER